MQADEKSEVLIVGDASGTAPAIAEMLNRDRTLSAVRSGSIEEALSRLRKQRPDAILLDVLLDSDADRENLSTLRKLAAAVPMIAVVEKPQRAAAVNLLAGLIDDYVLPSRIDSQSLARVIRRQLPLRQPGRVEGNGA